jgi:hypothetical protein
MVAMVSQHSLTIPCLCLLLASLQLALGMFFFFALGATGGMMSLIMQQKPIFERCVGPRQHRTTGW